MTSTLTELDHLELDLSSGNLMMLNVILGLIMFGVAIGIHPSDFKLVVSKPKMAWVGLLGQVIVLPTLTIVVIWMLNDFLSTGLAMGMILVASCPGGNISNFMVHLARGNTALSVGLTGFSTVGSLILTPVNFLLWGSVYSTFMSSEMDNPLLRELAIDPWEVSQSVFLLLGLPLAAGMLLTRFYPQVSKWLENPMRYISVTAFLAIVVIAFSKNLDAFVSFIGIIFGIVFIHNLVVIVGGYHWAQLWKLGRREQRTIALEMGIQNSGLGLVLLLNPKIFPPELPIGGMAAITAWWGIWHIIVGLGLAGIWRRSKPELAHAKS